MFITFLIVAAVSLLLQVLAAVLAMRLIRLTGASRAWIAIAAALLLMAIRRAVLLVGVAHAPSTLDPTEFWSEVIGLLNAIFLLLGVMWIGPLFRTIRQAQEAIRRSHDQLQHEMTEQSSRLAQTSEQATAESTRRAAAEAALREEHRHLTNVLEIYELDRKLVAYDIHDGFVQPATAAQMSLQAALTAYKSDPDKALEDVVRSLQQLQLSLLQTRLLIRGLRPVVLEEKGLVAAVTQLVHDTEANYEVEITWTPCVKFDRLLPLEEMSIFRIIQEGLTNAVRHAKSERVVIEMKQIDDRLQLVIEDWGVGFDSTLHKSGHFGLESIQERARLFGGTARIDSEPGRGTRVEVELPLKRDT